MAGVAVFLASYMSFYLTGQVIYVDEGHLWLSISLMQNRCCQNKTGVISVYQGGDFD
ncbi:MAG: hypothetical protein H5T41_09575 [Methanomassiliicoccales archaeon]|nr:hypothetical protein [Methanomassiliicoccales archaeon]